jgi:hypothetical protein
MPTSQAFSSLAWLAQLKRIFVTGCSADIPSQLCICCPEDTTGLAVYAPADGLALRRGLGRASSAFQVSQALCIGNQGFGT